jgi:hypothetical protein
MTHGRFMGTTSPLQGCGRRPFLPDRFWSRRSAGNSRVSCPPGVGCALQIQLTRRSVVAQLVVFRQRPESESSNGHVLWRLRGSLDWVASDPHPGVPVGYQVWGPTRRTWLTADGEQSTRHLHDIQLSDETSFGSVAHHDEVRANFANWKDPANQKLVLHCDCSRTPTLGN